MKSKSAIIDSFSIAQTNKEQAIYLQICDRIRHCVSQGLIKPGERIPSSRALADELSISRGTVDTAYNLLLSEGFIETKGQAGTIVSTHLEGKNLTLIDNKPFTLPFDHLIDQILPPLPFQMGLPALDSLPRKIWSRLGAKTLRGMQGKDFAYPDECGLLTLREKIATYLHVSRGVNASPKQIFITSGYRNSLSLLFKSFASKQVSVHVEDPCFIHTTQVLNAIDATLMPIDVDEHGIQTSKLNDEAKCVIITPAHQSPLSVTLSISRRLELLEWASHRDDRFIIEDDYDGEFHYASKPVPALKSLDTNNKVIYLGTFSKVLFPGIRLSYVVLPEPLVSKFTETIKIYQNGSDGFTQLLLSNFMQDGHFIRHIQAMRKLYKERYLLLSTHLTAALKDINIDVISNYGGMHLIIKVNDNYNDKIVGNKLKEMGFAAEVLSDWTINRRIFKGIMLGFTNISSEKMAKDLAAKVRHAFNESFMA